jgi:hypothetical protein
MWICTQLLIDCKFDLGVGKKRHKFALAHQFHFGSHIKCARCNDSTRCSLNYTCLTLSDGANKLSEFEFLGYLKVAPSFDSRVLHSFIVPTKTILGWQGKDSCLLLIVGSECH